MQAGPSYNRQVAEVSVLHLLNVLRSLQLLMLKYRYDFS